MVYMSSGRVGVAWVRRRRFRGTQTPNPPRDPQRAHIRRWLAGEVSEDDSEDY